MIKFDLNLSYQFGVFFGPIPEELSVASFDLVAEIMARDVEGVPKPRVILKTRRQGEAIVGQVGPSEDAQLSRVSVIEWSGPAMKLTWSPMRMDLRVDAHTFEELSGDELPLETVRRRVADNLVEVVRHLRLPVNRFVLAMTGESSTSGLDPASIVSRHFFRSSIVDGVAAGGIPELQARVNSRDRWSLPIRNADPEEVPINRLETGEARWSLSPTGTVRRSLVWNFDVNTSPELAQATELRIEAMSPFYERAAAWISSAKERIDEH